MSYSLIIPKSVAKQIKSLPSEFQPHIIEHLKSLQPNPRPLGYKKLRNTEGWRVRVGTYRVIFEIDDSRKEILLISVVHRKDAY